MVVISYFGSEAQNMSFEDSSIHSCGGHLYSFVKCGRGALKEHF